jgi:hypothetical protein
LNQSGKLKQKNLSNLVTIMSYCFRFTTTFGSRDYRQQNKSNPQQGFKNYGNQQFNPMGQGFSNYGGSYGGSYGGGGSNAPDWWGN